MLAFINLNKCKGNYVVDSDGNTLLDMAGTEFNPLGYNHEAMIKVRNLQLIRIGNLESRI